MEANPLKAIVIGGAAKARNFDITNYDDPTVEIWGFNAIRPNWIRRWDRMFNLHKYDLLRKYGWPVKLEGEWASENPNVPFMTADEWPDGRMANCTIFPREAMAEVMPRPNYHCNSFDWFIAYATFMSYDEIELHGCMVTTEGLVEQLSARSCIEYWSGYAEGRGTKVTCAKDSNLFAASHVVLSNRVYGYDDCPTYEDKTSNAPPEGSTPYRYDE
jgi:hypothetical protein